MIALNTVVRNEAHRIVEMLTRAGAYCDELVVVDQDSTDGTADLARDFGALVVPDRCHGCDEPSRELAGDHTQADWIVYLHADEHLTDEPIGALPHLVGSYYVGARFSSASFVDGERMNPWMGDHYHPDYQFRLFRRGCVNYPTELHSRISPKLADDLVFTGPKRPWIMDIKTRWESDLDEARYAELARA